MVLVVVILKKETGYKNIEDRIALLQGKLEVDSKTGFKVNVKLPYKA